MDTRDIRRLFVSFFAERGHRHVPSSSLIPPPDEKTLLFTTAGMVQMKPYFMGLARPPATRMTSIQKSFRTSDIEEVGDNRHCTFFEMLGNFSVGDYFKAEVIPWAWQILTDPQPAGLGLDKERMWATIFEEDEEAHDLWAQFLPEERIARYGEQHNYWFMGRVGPCGPNTEINYDFGEYDGQPPHDVPCHPQCEVPGCRRFIELWNLVFMTLYQDEDGSRRPLPQRNVDTGGGLERWVMPLLWQSQTDWLGNPTRWTEPPTIYDTDVFQPVLEAIRGDGYYYEASPEDQTAMRVLAEHARAAVLLIADGVTPSNEGRGYVLRRLIRRAVYFGSKLGQELRSPAAAVIENSAAAFPELPTRAEVVLKTLEDEELRFKRTLESGDTELEAEMDELSAGGQTVFPGSRAFYYEATLGFPIELTREIATRRGLQMDEAGYEAETERHREVSRVATHFEGDAERIQTFAELGLEPTEFVGYQKTRSLVLVSAIVLDGTTVVRTLPPELGAGHRVEVVLDHTPFYAEGGGQVGDRGEIVWPGGRFVVEDTQAVGDGGIIVHIGHLESGSLSAGDPVEARVDEGLRGDTMRNHTATHILHASLRQLIGTHVRQAGSLVTPDRLRFDFTSLEALTPQQIAAVEELANQVVRSNIPVNVEELSYEQALAEGALAFFGDKYADVVRVVGVCDPIAGDCFSRELCGGTHVHATGDVGVILITGESSIGAGLRRLEAVTGRAAVQRIREQEELVVRLSASLLVPPAEVEARLAALREDNDRLRRQLQATERRLARAQVEGAPAEASETEIAGVQVVVRNLPEAPSGDFLREVGDGLKSRYQSSVILLGAVIDGKPAFLAMATPDVSKRVAAGDIVRAAAQAAGGNGGGRPEIAQGGGSDPSKIDAALAAGRKLIEDKLRVAP